MRQVWPYRLVVQGLRLLIAGGALAAGFRRDSARRASRGKHLPDNFRCRPGPGDAWQKIAFMRRGFYVAVVERRNNDLHRAERTGNHATFTANAFVDSPVRCHRILLMAPLGNSERRAHFAMVAGYRRALRARFQDSDAG